MKTCLPILAVVITFMALFIENTEADGYGSSHGHSHSAKGTACIVKGSYCNCHYCKCEKGHVHCGGYGKGGHGKTFYPIILNDSIFRFEGFFLKMGNHAIHNFYLFYILSNCWLLNEYSLCFIVDFGFLANLWIKFL